ncbi:MAG: hypothetical protein ACXIU5_07465 [Halomonadaceae bacterium]
MKNELAHATPSLQHTTGLPATFPMVVPYLPTSLTPGRYLILLEGSDIMPATTSQRSFATSSIRILVINASILVADTIYRTSGEISERRIRILTAETCNRLKRKDSQTPTKFCDKRAIGSDRLN